MPLRQRRVGGTVLSVLFCLFSLGIIVALRAADPRPVEAVREIGFDLLQQLAPREYIDAPVRIVDIDEASLDRFGQWPWPRDRVAELVDRLQAAGAATIVFDFVFAEPDRLSPRRILGDPRLRSALGDVAASPDRQIPDNDAILAESIARGQVVLGFAETDRPSPDLPGKAGFAYTGADPSAMVPRLEGGAKVLGVLADAAAGLGSINISRTRSLVTVRRVPLLWSDDKNRLHPSLIAEALRVAQGARTYVIHASPETGGVQSVRIGQFEVPTEPTGELIVHYTRPHGDRYVSAVDVFDDQRLAELVPKIQGQIVLVGTSATGLFDIRTNALGLRTAGVEIHAQAIEQIIGGQFLLRHAWTPGLEVLALIVASLIVILTTLYGSARLALLFGGGVAAAIAASVWIAFSRYGLLIDATFPLAGGMFIWFVATAARYVMADREKRAISGAFSRYVSPTVLRQIERNHRDVRLGGENRTLTVMFSDVRNFTGLSESMRPEEVVTFLNALLGRLANEIANEGGVLDKFIGDSVMAFWNAPLDQPDHAHLACRAALRMRKALEEMNASHAFQIRDEADRPAAVAIGIGINTGTACVGNVGSTERFSYSAIGDAVNVAARTEEACKHLGYDIVVTETTAAEVPDFAFLPAGRIEIRGKAGRVPLLILVGGPALRSTGEFEAFERRYGDLIEALRDGRRHVADDAMEQCRRAARELDHRLLRYLALIPTRLDDFRTHPPPEVRLSAGA